MKRPSLELVIVIAGTMIIVLLGFAQQTQKSAQQSSTFSSFDTGPNGYRALYEVLDQEHVPVERIENELAFLQNAEISGQPAVQTLIVSSEANQVQYQAFINPLLSRSDVKRMRLFVKNGLHLIVLTKYPKQFKDSAADLVPGKGRTQRLTQLFPGTVTIATYSLGKGSVSLIDMPEIFSNRNIARGENARFAYDVLRGHGPVGFYERNHGYTIDKSFWTALPAPVHAAIYLAIGIVLLGLIGANVRFAPPVPLDPPDERDSSAYITGMAAVLRRAKLRRHTASANPLDASIEMSWLLAGTAPGDAALVRAALLQARSRKEPE